MAWIEAISAGRDWDEARDATRIQQAFITLATTRETWPAPRHFLDALPRIEQRAITREFRPASPEVVAKARAEMEAWMREVDVSEPEPPPAPRYKPETSPEERAQAERELSQHYTDRKSAAAGERHDET